MSDEDRIIELMTEQNGLRSRISRLDGELKDASFLKKTRLAGKRESLQAQHQAVVAELVELMDGPLRAAFAGARRRIEQAGCQYTEMVHDFFVKLWERKVRVDRPLDGFHDIKRLVATVLFNQVRDFLKVATRRREIERDVIAQLVKKRQTYWNERYRVEFHDAILELDGWLTGNDGERRQIAEMINLRYVVGENWGEIAHVIGISDEKLTALRHKAREYFQQT
ncbi:MAG: hypothetical protein O3B13_25195 [Planctomycetota bacterium]|nr:hypothetical protein [Planctomycetota bacterium]